MSSYSRCASGPRSTRLRYFDTNTGGICGTYSASTARKVASIHDQYPVQQFAADSVDPSFGDCIRSGARTGVRRMRRLSLANTASNTASNMLVNSLSRSRVTNLNSAARSLPGPASAANTTASARPDDWRAHRPIPTPGRTLPDRLRPP